MDAWHQDDRATIYHGDCLEVLRALPDASVDAVVTDPPYGLEFMGKDWDKFKTGRAAKYSAGGELTTTEFKNLGTLPQYVSRPAKRCANCAG
jgi:site-specific DNA-methyltransferase (adenine-specific)